jgi:positive regulator of sigma E activity
LICREALLSFEGKPTMLTKTVSIISAAALALVATSAFAQGHIAGGAVGAMAGAKSHHAVAGAVVGGAVGHHMAKTHAKKMAKKAGKKG